MCPKIRDHPDQLPLPLLNPERRSGARQGVGCRSEPSESGSTPSPGPTGPPSLSDRLSDMTVRLHQGLSHMSVGSLSATRDIPGTFAALKKGGLDGYTLMLSCALTSTEYGALIAALEGPPTVLGESVSVALEFVPTTPNLVPPTTAPST